MSRVLVVGGGGREHALCWKLAHEAEVVCSPGNPGIEQVADCVPIPAEDGEALTALAVAREVDLVVIGPEAPLIDGLADQMRARGLRVFGPGENGARLEADKGWSKDTMRRAGVPTAAGMTFTESSAAIEWCRARFEEGKGVAVKATGPALGKGVVVAAELELAEATILDWMDSGGMGAAGEKLLLEERLLGREFSLLTLATERGIASLPVAQDYKRLTDGDTGPNTGGMGSFAPAAWVSEGLVLKTEERVVKPLLSELTRAGVPYRGMLFSGLMVVEGEPFCLEYNVRFGDPETQSVLRLMGAGFLDALIGTADGSRPERPDVLPGCSVTVVCAADGYPISPQKGQPITIGNMPEGAVAFHSGTKWDDGSLRVSGGRVVSVSATGPDLASARALAYAGVSEIQYSGKHFRTDIASSGN
ncbi:MAG: phosphoribosylamine--glycine ligase [Fimbriimonadaceae bacterium]|nr:phosphoribosylamine--glycine ligase [Fimbriimonadaceae bacterium]